MRKFVIEKLDTPLSNNKTNIKVERLPGTYKGEAAYISVSGFSFSNLEFKMTNEPTLVKVCRTVLGYELNEIMDKLADFSKAFNMQLEVVIDKTDTEFGVGYYYLIPNSTLDDILIKYVASLKKDDIIEIFKALANKV